MGNGTMAGRRTAVSAGSSVLGLVVWIALAFGGVWFVHQFTRSKASCGGRIEARTAQPKGQAAGPRNSLQLLTGTGRCE